MHYLSAISSLDLIVCHHAVYNAFYQRICIFPSLFVYFYIYIQKFFLLISFLHVCKFSSRQNSSYLLNGLTVFLYNVFVLTTLIARFNFPWLDTIVFPQNIFISTAFLGCTSDKVTYFNHFTLNTIILGHSDRGHS